MTDADPPQTLQLLPRRSRIEVRDEVNFPAARILANQIVDPFTAEPGATGTLPDSGQTGRYVRLTAPEFIHGVADPGYLLILSKIGAISDGIDVAEGRAVSVDPIDGNRDAQQITRKTRWCRGQ